MRHFTLRPAPRRPARGQRGAAALAVTLLLLAVVTLGATVVQRSLVFEQRAAANQYAAAQAFEAAEAGLQWIEAGLNANRRVGADCLPGSAPADASIRERYLWFDATTGVLTPRGPLAAGASPTGRPGCVAAADGFACSCPASGPAALRLPGGDAPSPAFRVELLATPTPGVVRAVATGCSSALPPCTDAAAGRAAATVRVEVALGLLGALRAPSGAVVTTGGRVDGPAADIVGGAPSAVRAGGAIVLGGATSAPRAPFDPWLASRTADRLFAATFGLDKPHWKAQPAVTRVACRVDCAAVLREAVRDSGPGAMVWVDGDLELAGPASIGSTARPVVIVVDGAARLRGAVELHGVVYAGSIAWNDAAPDTGASLAGALIVEHDVVGDAAVAFRDDAAAIATLTRFAGSFARVSGSWRDF